MLLRGGGGNGGTLCAEGSWAAGRNAAVAGLTLVAFGPQPAGAQLRPPAPTLTDLALQASQELGVPCNAYYSTGTFECSGYRDGIYIYLSAHPMYGDPNPNNLYVFDPYTGRSAIVIISVDDVGNVYFYVVDSELGIISFTDGWLSVFYPTGNPFSAAVHDPSQVVINIYADSGTADQRRSAPAPHLSDRGLTLRAGGRISRARLPWPRPGRCRPPGRAGQRRGPGR